jgi:hypothetical protein
VLPCLFKVQTPTVRPFLPSLLSYLLSFTRPSAAEK